VLFHVDAVQALGHVPIDLAELPVDLMSFSAHKLNGPKGIGALYIAKQTHIAPLIYGGQQERKRRPGTENVPAIVGFGKAVELFARERYELQQNLETIRHEMVSGLISRLGEAAVVVNGHPTERLAHILNVSFPGIATETMLMNLDLEGVAAASGSACTSGSLEVSHVLQAMKLPREVTASAIRFSFGRDTNLEQIVKTVTIIETICARLRSRV